MPSTRFPSTRTPSIHGPSVHDPSSRGPSIRNRLQRPTAVKVLIGVYLAALATVLVLAPDGLRTTADPGAATVPVWVAILPSFVGIALVLLLPRRATPMRPEIVDARRFGRSTGALIALAVLYPLACIVLALGPEDTILAKFLLLLVVPAIVIAVLRPAVRIPTVPGAWRWWAPGVVILVWILLSQVAPWNPRFELGDHDAGFVILAAVATAITAGLGEELFYRRWLQTRLEARLDPWVAIGLTSLAFALMHLATHRSGDLLLDIATAITFQGAFGVFVGVMWMRYRNLAAIILVHLLINGWGVVAALLVR